MRKLKWLSLIGVTIFCMPLVLQFYPQQQPETTTPQLVFASHDEQQNKNVLVMFTHSHEAYAPMVEAQLGKTLYYDDSVNIKTLAEPLTAAFSNYGVTMHTMEADVMQTMKLSHSKFHEAYKVARPFIKQSIEQAKYDLILDLHRDSAKKTVTTLQTATGSFAKIAIVIGLEHPTYEWNLAYAEALHNALEQLMPGISRGILKKEGEGVDGIYNQDLAKEMLLVEIGGIDNNEQELLATLTILAQAIQQILANEPMKTTAI